MDQYQEYIYYVYKHVDPRNNEVVYIGHGCKARAWVMGTSTASVRKYGHRKPEHQQWMEDLTEYGFTPADWVKIEVQGLDKGSACEVEQNLIRQYTPKFNSLQGQALLKLVRDDILFAKEMRQDGMPYWRIAEELEVSTMAVYRAVNGRNKNEPAQ